MRSSLGGFTTRGKSFLAAGLTVTVISLSPIWPAICLLIIPPTNPPSGPPTRMAWLRVVLPPEPDETLHTKANRVSGITVVSSLKDVPGTTSVS